MSRQCEYPKCKPSKKHPYIHRCLNPATVKAGDDGRYYCKQHAAMPHTWAFAQKEKESETKEISSEKNFDSAAEESNQKH